MIQVIEQGDKFGKLGKAFMKGLGEGIPKAIERRQFSEDVGTLQSLIKEKKLTPFQLSMGASMVRGASPEQQKFLYSSLLSQMQAEEAEEGRRLIPPTTSIEPDRIVSDQIAPTTPQIKEISPVEPEPRMPKTVEEFVGEERFAREPVSLVDENLQEKLREGPPVVTDAEIEARASELLRTKPSRTKGDMDTAREIARREADDDLKKYQKVQAKVQEQEKQQESYDKKYDDKLALITQKTGFEDLSGENKLFAKQQIRQEIKDGKKPDTAIDEWVRRSKNLATAKNSLKDLPKRPVFGRGSEDNIKILRKFVPAYKEFGAQRELVEDLKTFAGIGPFLANSIVYDPSKELTSTMKDIPKNRLTTFLSSNSYTHPKLSEEQKTNLMNSIQSTDSIQAIQLSLADKGYNDLDFVNFLREKSSTGEKKFNDRQENELITTDQVNVGLSEALNSAIYGLFTSVKTPMSEQIRRALGKR
jgi:hypothetical protein